MYSNKKIYIIKPTFWCTPGNLCKYSATGRSQLISMMYLLPPHKSLGTSVTRLRVVTSDLGALRSGPLCVRCSVVSVVFY